MQSYHNRVEGFSMPLSAHRLPFKTKAKMAAAGTYGTAVALREHSAAFVSFQWQRPNLPPTQNVNSAPHSLTSAAQFSGKYAILATNAAFSTGGGCTQRTQGGN